MKWAFDNDDENHNINTALKTALTDYKTQFGGFANDGTSSIKTVQTSMRKSVFDILGNRRNAIEKGLNIVESEGGRMKIIK